MASINKLIVVSNHLPVAFKPNSLGDFGLKTKHLNGITAAVKDLCANGLMGTQIRGIEDYVWVGMPRFQSATSQFSKELLERKDQLFQEFRCVPVTVPPELYTMHMNGFCQDIIWPVFHYRLTTGKSTNFNEKDWNAHLQVTQQFAKAIAEIYREGDTIWIQDYHLMMLPSILRKLLNSRIPKSKQSRLSQLNSLRIGFYLHAPFPSCAIFPMLPVRRELLEGMLGSTMIGFQTYEDMNHFTDSCTRILGLDNSPKGVEVPDGRVVSFGVYPMSINPDRFKETIGLPTVVARIAELKRLFPGCRIMVGRDRGDQVEGVPCKLRALERFFAEFPQWVGKVVYFQICPPASSEDDAPIYKDIHELVGRINGRFGGADFMPVHYLSKRISWEELVSLYSAADVAVVTPLGDGYTPTPLEYTVCQNMDGRHGVLVLSEFTAAAQSLGGAIQVNPWSKREVANALNEALSLCEDERRAKHLVNYEYVQSYTTHMLSKAYLSELVVRAENPHSSWRRSGPGSGSLTPGMSLADMSVQAQHLQPLDHSELVMAYKNSSHRLILLNYDGVLCSMARFPHLSVPSARAIKLLDVLSSDYRNEVYLMSGRDKDTLDRCVAHLPVGVAAEHGCFLKPCPSAITAFSPVPFFSNASTPAASPNLFGQSSLRTSASGRDISLVGLNNVNNNNNHQPLMRTSASGRDVSLNINIIHNNNNNHTPGVPSDDSIGLSRSPLSPGLGSLSLVDNQSNHNGNNGWLDMLRGADMSWLDVIMPVLEHYTERTPGSFIERKQASVVWHYRVCDPEYSAFQAQELLLQLHSVVAKYPVEVVMGKKAIEVKPKAANLGSLAKKIMGPSPSEIKYDFVLCMGDDRSDEDMFKSLEEADADRMEDVIKQGFGCAELALFTCTVRKRANTNARFYVHSQPSAVDVLESLSEASAPGGSATPSPMTSPCASPLFAPSMLAPPMFAPINPCSSGMSGMFAAHGTYASPKALVPSLDGLRGSGKGKRAAMTLSSEGLKGLFDGQAK